MSDPIAFANLCSQFATANGTGTFALGARTDTKYFTIPEKIEVGSLVGYVARQGNLSEEGYGLLQSETQLTRIAAFDSSSTGISNNINPGSPALVSFDPTASIQVYCAVPARLFISLDAEGNPTDPSPFRNALFVQSVTEMKAEQGLSDGEAFFCANNGLFYFDASDATSPDNIDTFRPDNYPGGLFKRMRLDIQGDVLGVSIINASGTVANSDVVGAELKLYANPKATNPNDWHSIFADVTNSALRLRSRLNQSSGVKNFLSVFSLGTTADRVEVHEPLTLPTRTDATGLVTRAMSWLSGSSRLAFMMAGGGTREVALVKGFPVLYKLDIYALKQEDIGLISIQDGDVAVTRGSNTVSGNSTEANAGNVQPINWYWASSSSATEDLVNVVRPSVGAAATGNGRWLREVSDITANGTFTSGVSAPSVKNGSWFITAGSTALTDFVNGYEGQVIVIQRGSADIVVTHDSTKIDLGGANITLKTSNPRLVLQRQGSVWHMIGGISQSILNSKMDAVAVTTGLNKGLNITQTGSGVLGTSWDGQQPNGFNFNFINISDAIDGPTDQSYSTQGLGILHKVGGAAVEGTRTAIYSECNLTAATSSSNTNRFWCGGGFVGRASANDGGTSGAKRGALFGGYGAAIIDAGSAAHLANVTAWEYNISVPSGNTVGYKSMLQMAALPGDVVQGTFEAMIACSANIGSVGWERIIAVTSANGQQPLTSTGSIIRATIDELGISPPTAKDGINIDGYNFTGSAFKSIGFSVNGSGAVTSVQFASPASTPLLFTPANNVSRFQAGEINIDLYTTTAATNTKKTRIAHAASDGSVTMYALNDAENAASAFWTAYRTTATAKLFEHFTPIKLPSYLTANLPTLVSGNDGSYAVASDGYGGAKGLVRWDGAAWKRADNNQAPSTTGVGYVRILKGSAAFDCPSLANGQSNISQASPLGITVTGAALGDGVQVACSIDTAGLSLTGYVRVADEVRVIVTNNTGGTVDLANATYYAYVTKA